MRDQVLIIETRLFTEQPMVTGGAYSAIAITTPTPFNTILLPPWHYSRSHGICLLSQGLVEVVQAAGLDKVYS